MVSSRGPCFYGTLFAENTIRYVCLFCDKFDGRLHMTSNSDSVPALADAETIDPSLDLIPKRFYSLDVIRGVAALAIVFWHWKHFYYFNGSGVIELEGLREPFYDYLFVLYEKGLFAVEFFFALSGFIFYWLYSDSVSKGKVQVWNFAVLRLSRLYPLHFATLILVLGFQIITFYRAGEFFVYPFNDLHHFVLNVLFMSYWGMESGESFNGPTWSVSIEVLLYVIFFAVCRARLVKGRHLLVFAVSGHS